ncbi:MAG: hypothetical protein GX838_02325 [Clostridiaceae bacterium]|nr:hypothetical protein [Clostridiaceae bacterium]
MKHLVGWRAIALLVLTVLFMATAITVFSCRRSMRPPTDGLDLTTTNSSTTTSSLSTETAPNTTTETTTTETTTTEPEIVYHYSHMIVFLDIQRVVFFHTPEHSPPVAEVSLRISTGKKKGTTPTTPRDKPFILSGYTPKQLLFTKDGNVWVRHATHVSGDIFFHSQPYTYYQDADGKAVPLDKSRFNLAGYRQLGISTTSNGCIRLSIRDAIFIQQNIHKGMPVYIFDSSKGYDIPEAPVNPAPSLGNGWDPTDMDPANPYRQKEKNNMAWQYKPIGIQPYTLVGQLIDPAQIIGNKDALPAGTTYRYLHIPDVSVPVLRTVFILVVYPDGSYEEIRTRIRVVEEIPPEPTEPDPPPTTVAPTTTTTTTTTTVPPATTTTEETTTAAETTTTTTESEP